MACRYTEVIHPPRFFQCREGHLTVALKPFVLRTKAPQGGYLLYAAGAPMALAAGNPAGHGCGHFTPGTTTTSTRGNTVVAPGRWCQTQLVRRVHHPMQAGLQPDELAVMQTMCRLGHQDQVMDMLRVHLPELWPIRL